VAGQDDGLVQAAPMPEIVEQRMPAWQACLALETPGETIGRPRPHEPTMRPLGGAGVVGRAERRPGRGLRPESPDRPRKQETG